MDMSADEIKEYWRDFCGRHKVSEALCERGAAQIDADPEYWADHTMHELLESLSAFRR